MMDYWISADDITKGPIAELEVGARIRKCPQTDPGVSIEDRRVLDVVCI
jgi:hypothetical protein